MRVVGRPRPLKAMRIVESESWRMRKRLESVYFTVFVERPKIQEFLLAPARARRAG